MTEESKSSFGEYAMNAEGVSDLGETKAPRGEVTYSVPATNKLDKLIDSIKGISADSLLFHVLGEDDAQFRESLRGELFSFSVALMAMRRGLYVARSSWKVPGKYVFIQSPPTEFIRDPATETTVPVKEHMVWRNGEGRLVPWAPSQDAALANDWFVGKSGDYPRSTPSEESTADVEVTTFDNSGNEGRETRRGVVKVPSRFLDAARGGGETVNYDEDCISVHLGNEMGISLHIE